MVQPAPPATIQVSRSPDPAWNAVLAKARAVDKLAGVPYPAKLTQRDTLPPAQAAPLRQAVLVVPVRLEPGVAIAVKDLQSYLQAVTVQDHPDESLTQILDGALAPLGGARTPMVRLLIDAMEFQETFLLEKNLIRYLQGFDGLTDFGVAAQENPILGKVLKGTNSTPVRRRPDEMLKWDARQLAAFERGDLADLATIARTSRDQASRADGLRAQVPPEAPKLQDELADGFRINALRAAQVLELERAVVLLRRSQLQKDPALEARADARLAAARAVTAQAMAAIADREKDDREGPEYDTATGKQLTIWNDRYLTPVHTAKYWRNSYDEVAKLLGQPKLP